MEILFIEKKIDPYDWFCGPGSHLFTYQYWMLELREHLMWTLLGFSFQCENCDLHFRHKSQLRLHLRQKHGAVTNTKVQYRRSRTDLPVASLVTSWKHIKLFQRHFIVPVARKAIRKYRYTHGSLSCQCPCLLVWWRCIFFLKYGLVHQHILVQPAWFHHDGLRFYCKYWSYVKLLSWQPES